MRVGAAAQLNFLNDVVSAAADGTPCGGDKPVEMDVRGKMSVQGRQWNVDAGVKLSGEGEVELGNGNDASELQLSDQPGVPWQSVRVKAQARIVVRKSELTGALSVDFAARASVEGASTIQRFALAGRVAIKPLSKADKTVVKGDFQANGDQGQLDFEVGDNVQDKTPLVDVLGGMTGQVGALTITKGDCSTVAEGGIILMRWTSGTPRFPARVTITCTPSGTDAAGRRRAATSCESTVTVTDGQATAQDSACPSASAGDTTADPEGAEDSSAATSTAANVLALGLAAFWLAW